MCTKKQRLRVIFWGRRRGVCLRPGGRRRSADRVVAARAGVLAFSVLAQETVEGFLLADRELSGLDAGVVDTQEGIDIVHRLCPHVGELLDLSGDILDLKTE